MAYVLEIYGGPMANQTYLSFLFYCIICGTHKEVKFKLPGIWGSKYGDTLAVKEAQVAGTAGPDNYLNRQFSSFL
jgi:hypothetical protein